MRKFQTIVRLYGGQAVSQLHKICPRCQTQALIDAQYCSRCGHGFRTQFQPDQTVLGVPPHQTPYQPPQPPAGYPYGAQHPYAPPGPYHSSRGGIQLPPGYHSPGVAVLLSLLLTGGGQMYNRQVPKGVAVLVGTIFIAIGTAGFGVVPCLVLAAVDAFRIADRLRAGEPVGHWQWF